MEHLIHQTKRITTNRSADSPEILLMRQLLVRRALSAAVGALKPGEYMLKGWDALLPNQRAEGVQRDVGDATTSAMLLGRGTKPDPSSMAADVYALEKLAMDAIGDIDEESSWSKAGFESSTTECQPVKGFTLCLVSTERPCPMARGYRPCPTNACSGPRIGLS